MSYILDGLYLGEADYAYDRLWLERYGITHILTVEAKPLPLSAHEGMSYKYIHALDMDSTDLIEHFHDSSDFIEAGRKAGSILVHCAFGQSRSATLVLAYIMQTMDMSLDDALTIVMKQRPQIRPNHGFKKQLELYESTNYLSSKTDEYTMYKLNKLTAMLHLGQLDDGNFPADSLVSDPANTSISQDGQHEISYKCKKCRRVLFRESAIMSHDPGIGDAAFDWRGDVKGATCTDSDVESCGTSLFIQPVQWMSDNILNKNGKLQCPKCKAKLGSFNWSGEQCACGAWVTPAFHIQVTKVDESRPRPIPQSTVQTKTTHNPQTEPTLPTSVEKTCQ